MKPFKIINQIKVHIILSSVLICVCTRDIPNPLLDSFEGDYRFDVQWDSLTNKDTLEIFKYYSVPFMVNGTDPFTAFRITDSNNISIINIDNYQALNSDSILVCYFAKPYTGNIYIKGIRPNNKEVVKKSPLPLTIINPFRVTIDSLQDRGNRYIARVQKWFNGNMIPESLSTVWNIGDNLDTVFGLSKNYSATRKEFTVTARIIDVFNNSLSFDSIFVTISGFYPVIDTVIITKNPYLGEQCSFFLIATDLDSTRFRIFTDFNKKPLFNTYPFYQSNKKMDVVTENPFTDTGKGMFTVFLIDSSGLRSNIFKDSIFIAYRLRTPVFDSNWLTTSIDRPHTIRIVDTNFTDATLYRWQIKRLGIDSTTYSDSFTVTWTDTIQDTVIISGIDSIGYRGPPDTLIVKPELHSYTLNKELFPQEIQALVVTTFQINVRDENGTVVNDRASFFWFMENESTLDSVYRNRDTLRIRAGSKTDSFSMSVRAIVNGSDTTNTIIDTVIVVKTPVSVFSQSSYKVLVGDTVTLKVNPGDITAIDSIYIGFDSQVIGLVKETSHRSVFFSSDTIIAYTWAVTDWGVKTGIDSTVIVVYSDPPALYSNTESFDTAVFINDTVTIRVQGYPGNGISTITHYFWDLNGDYLWDDTTEVNYYNLTKSTRFDDTIHVGCINDLGDTAAELFRFHLVVNVGSPTVEKVSCDTTWAFINDRINLFINATDSNGAVYSLYIDTNSDGQGDIIIRDITQAAYTDTVPLYFSGPGTYKVSVWAQDDEKNLSSVYHLSKLITIDRGLPQITGVVPDTVFIMDENTFFISALDNKTIVEYRWSFNNIDFLLGDVNNFAHSFSDSGWHRLYVGAKDDENNHSPVFPDSVYVIWAAPYADSVLPRTVWVSDLNEFTFYFHDTNGSVETLMINWGDGSTTTTITDLSGYYTVQSHSYPKTSDTTYIISAEVEDNDNITSLNNFTLHVREGRPVIRSISVDTTDDHISVAKNWKYHINAFDLNGYITKLSISFDGDNEADSIIIFSNQASRIDTFITHAYSIKNAGNQTIKYWIEDDDGYVSETKDTTVFVRLFPPVLWGSKNDTVWVKDTNEIVIIDSDTNGYIIKRWVDWDVDDVWDDSSTVTNTFTHWWDTTLGGKFAKFNVKIMDDDSLTTEKVCSVMVRMGRPRVWVDGDTLFVPCPKGGGYIDFSVNSIDSNGTIRMYYYDLVAGNGFDTSVIHDDKRTDSTYKNYLADEDDVKNIAVFAIDDDGFMVGDTFWLYPDGAPPVPTLISPVHNFFIDTSQQITLTWSGEDFYDGSSTEYAIIWENGNSTPSDTLINFTGGNSGAYVVNGPEYSYTFKVRVSGIYYWRIASRDRSGSTEQSTVRTIAVSPRRVE